MDEPTPGQQSDAHETISRLAEEVVPTLIDRLANSDLGELEVREGGWRIRLRRLMNGAAADAPHGADHQTIGPAPSYPPAPSSPPAPVRGLVTSPGVGYFTPRSGVEAGAKVRAGDPLGHIDVLGVRHDVVSPVDGTLRSFDAEPGQAVEYGQPIARVEAEA
jgi:acetyl-CoA carboxylase biotin carboxyl carrier protein